MFEDTDDDGEDDEANGRWLTAKMTGGGGSRSDWIGLTTGWGIVDDGVVGGVGEPVDGGATIWWKWSPPAPYSGLRPIDALDDDNDVLGDESCRTIRYSTMPRLPSRIGMTMFKASTAIAKPSMTQFANCAFAYLFKKLN